ncbi:hypothetical protein NO348_05185 [Hungatella hathewayi]|uniref:hypothetical protein n=1 Tax=Hungatella hathewayi TaxID=154046 RepID=UPI00210DABDC|nr:hypothetical protein [Hungatella hathewayi]MCQ5384205.1 hypothetical protein [Hungatella hathewayi]
MNFNVYIPTRVLFGAGCLNDLHTQIMPGKKSMLECDRIPLTDEECTAIYEKSYR